MSTPSDGPEPRSAPDHVPLTEAQAHFRRTLIRVMAVQVGALLLLWWLQSRYAR